MNPILPRRHGGPASGSDAPCCLCELRASVVEHFSFEHRKHIVQGLLGAATRLQLAESISGEPNPHDSMIIDSTILGLR